MDKINGNNITKASPDELNFINSHMPRGMVAMIQVRTGSSRSQIRYQLERNPRFQNPLIIQAAREILQAVTGKRFEHQLQDH